MIDIDDFNLPPEVEISLDDKFIIKTLNDKNIWDTFNSMIANTKKKVEGLNCTVMLHRLKKDIEYFMYVDDDGGGDSGFVYIKIKDIENNFDTNKIVINRILANFIDEPTLIELGNMN